jgi:hypothetical protein
MATVVEKLRRKSAYLNQRYKGMDVADAEGILYILHLNMPSKLYSLNPIEKPTSTPTIAESLVGHVGRVS